MPRRASVFMWLSGTVINTTNLCKFTFLPWLVSLTPILEGMSPWQARLHAHTACPKFECERNKSLSGIFSYLLWTVVWTLVFVPGDKKPERKDVMTLNIVVLFLEFLIGAIVFPSECMGKKQQQLEIADLKRSLFSPRCLHRLHTYSPFWDWCLNLTKMKKTFFSPRSVVKANNLRFSQWAGSLLLSPKIDSHVLTRSLWLT